MIEKVVSPCALTMHAFDFILALFSFVYAAAWPTRGRVAVAGAECRYHSDDDSIGRGCNFYSQPSVQVLALAIQVAGWIG